MAPLDPFNFDLPFIISALCFPFDICVFFSLIFILYAHTHSIRGFTPERGVWLVLHGMLVLAGFSSERGECLILLCMLEFAQSRFLLWKGVCLILLCTFALTQSRFLLRKGGVFVR